MSVTVFLELNWICPRQGDSQPPFSLRGTWCYPSSERGTPSSQMSAGSAGPPDPHHQCFSVGLHGLQGEKRRNQTFYFGVMSKLTFLRIISMPLWRIQCPALVKRNEHHTERTLGTSFELIQNVGSGSHLIAWHILLLFLPIFPLPSSGGIKKNHQGEEGV